jgi:hypothetical protein
MIITFVAPQFLVAFKDSSYVAMAESLIPNLRVIVPVTTSVKMIRFIYSNEDTMKKAA